MGNTLRPEHVSRFFLLILSVMSGLLNLPQATCKTCNTKTVIPEIKISSSPPNHTLAIGAALNMTCIAWPRYDDKLFPRRWIKYIRWYDPQGRPTGAKCLQGTPSVLKLHCTLMLRTITSEQFGNYTCEAENDYSGYCRQKTVEIVFQESENIVTSYSWEAQWPDGQRTGFYFERVRDLAGTIRCVFGKNTSLSQCL
ncbi:uncharacterized protein LOC111347542 [Stylophora pistillata]|uniref:uncharacterized protein LOC111347542 n=1 Tax=Stylophora pistillata TaxID=50429 RepID=UPI000C056F9B|nr:uncharacterized protein LOC111347542 [Stylophora pistillata]